MSYECGSIAARIPPDVWSEGASNAVQIHLKCSENAPGMAAEHASNIQELKQNAVRIFRMYFKCTSNITRMSRVYQECGRVAIQLILCAISTF